MKNEWFIEILIQIGQFCCKTVLNLPTHELEEVSQTLLLISTVQCPSCMHP